MDRWILISLQYPMERWRKHIGFNSYYIPTFFRRSRRWLQWLYYGACHNKEQFCRQSKAHSAHFFLDKRKEAGCSKQNVAQYYASDSTFISSRLGCNMHLPIQVKTEEIAQCAKKMWPDGMGGHNLLERRSESKCAKQDSDPLKAKGCTNIRRDRYCEKERTQWVRWVLGRKGTRRRKSDGYNEKYETKSDAMWKSSVRRENVLTKTKCCDVKVYGVLKTAICEFKFKTDGGKFDVNGEIDNAPKTPTFLWIFGFRTAKKPTSHKPQDAFAKSNKTKQIISNKPKTLSWIHSKFS